MLTPQEIETLDQNGYLFLGELLTPTQVQEVNNRLAGLMATEGENAGKASAGSVFIFKKVKYLLTPLSKKGLISLSYANFVAKSILTKYNNLMII